MNKNHNPLRELVNNLCMEYGLTDLEALPLAVKIRSYYVIAEKLEDINETLKSGLVLNTPENTPGALEKIAMELANNY
jgi:hypothetical protein